MGKALMVAAAVVLGLHGLIHLLGTVAYWRLGTVEGLPYKTTLLGGRVDVGDGGMRAVGALWGIAAVAFVGAAVGWLAGWDAWVTVLISATVLSLVLTALDWTIAFRGAIVDVAILALVWFGPRLAPTLGVG